MSSRLLSLIRKEFLQLFRNWVLVILVLYTFIEIALCGLALFIEVNDLPLAVYDADRTGASRALITKLSISEQFSLRYRPASQADLQSLIDGGEVRMGLVIPARFERDLARGDTVRVQIIADGSDAFTAGVALGYAEQIIGAHSRRIELQRLGLPKQTVLAQLPVVVNRIRARYDPDLNFTNFNMTTMLALTLPLLGILLGSISIVREREVGTLEQLMVTPIRPWELMTAKLLPIGVVKIVGLGFGIAIAVWGFGVPLRGSLGLFVALSGLVLVVGMGLGIAIGTVTKTGQQSLLLSFALIFPIMFLSGMMAPLYNMPTVLQWLSMLNPLRYYMTITLGIFLKGVGLSVLWPQVLGLAVLGIAIFGASLIQFRRSLG